MSITLVVPELTGGRKAANRLVDAKPYHLTGACVTLDMRATKAGTLSFADEIVKVVVLQNRAKSLNIIGAYHDMQRWIKESAQAHGVSGKVTFSG